MIARGQVASEADVRVLVCPDRDEHRFRAAELFELRHQDVSGLNQGGDVETDGALTVDRPEHVVRDPPRKYRHKAHHPHLFALHVSDGPLRVEPECQDVRDVLNRHLGALLKGDAVVAVGLHVRYRVEDCRLPRKGLEEYHVVGRHLVSEVKGPLGLYPTHHRKRLVGINGVEYPPQVPLPEVDTATQVRAELLETR